MKINIKRERKDRSSSTIRYPLVS